MAKMWIWVNMMQLLTALALLTIKFPENVLAVQEHYMGLFSFDLIPQEWEDNALE